MPGSPTDNLWVILVDFNGIDDTRKCLDSLAGQPTPPRTVVVDNASRTDVAAALAAEFPWASFVRSSVNGGWAGGNNLGMKFALERGADLMILLNNDTTVAPDFVDRLRAAAASHPDYGVLGPVIRYMAPPCEVQTDGVRFNHPSEPGFFQRHPVALDRRDPPVVAEVDIVNGCCLMVRRGVVEKIGYVDEQFFLIHEESDFCLRTQRAGFRNGVVAEALVWHKGSSTFKREGKGFQRYFDARNLVRLLKRHGRRRGSRGLIPSFAHYLRYAYHRFATERESGFDASATAVLEGFYDALLGRYGPHSEASRPGLGVLRWVFSTAWKWGGGRVTATSSGPVRTTPPG
ncbi:glycosyltransferase family 2 protein [Fimbriiglobus ruber]|uniref:Glycosyl transferase, family 2 n=1 Tax=Fimbriiglobus ruber TaxID=1908690 RepID=A0A225DTE4_9BACT|nr:glycosyltransferase family 2 protein [Fimbriiglobus ruber]OWK40449.1 Glycosyl transferase, family 2 [Fimbriiglobus ruber]